MKRIFKWIGIGFVGLALTGIGIHMNDRRDTPPPNATTEPLTATAEARPANPIPYRMGDTVPVQDLAYTIHRIEVTRQIGAGIIQAKADGYFLMVNLTVTNTGEEAATIDSSMFALFEPDGFRYAANGAAAMYMEGNRYFFLTKLSPRSAKTGYVIFDVPTREREYLLQVTGGMQSAETEVLRLDTSGMQAGK